MQHLKLLSLFTVSNQTYLLNCTFSIQSLISSFIVQNECISAGNPLQFAILCSKLFAVYSNCFSFMILLQSSSQNVSLTLLSAILEKRVIREQIHRPLKQVDTKVAKTGQLLYLPSETWNLRSSDINLIPASTKQPHKMAVDLFFVFLFCLSLENAASLVLQFTFNFVAVPIQPSCH